MECLTVKTRRPGLVVRARRGYASGVERDRKQDARDAMTRLLDSRLPGGALSVEMQATAFPRATDGARVMVVLEIDGRALRFHAAGARHDASLTYRVVATNVYGEAKAQEGRQVHFTVSDARRHQIEQSRVRLVSQLDLPPGSYRLRAAVIAGDQQGVVLGDVDVANYRKLPVARGR